MEQIYTVRVKWRPDPCLSFPSERAYSSSTVGGLAVAHLFLALLALTLSTLGYASTIWRGEYVGGVMLVIGGVSAGVTGLLACKKWYVDRYIRWFLGAAVLSSAAALLSTSLTAFVLLAPPSQDDNFLLSNSTNLTEGIVPLGYNDSTAVGEVAEDEEEGGSGVIGESEFRHEIYVHLLLASLVELVWSALSVKIAWKGCKKSGAKGRKAPVPGAQTPRGRPDILQNLRKESPVGLGDPRFTNYSDVVRELCRLQGGSAPQDQVNPSGLPLPESNLEYRQRIEKFLADNTAVS